MFTTKLSKHSIHRLVRPDGWPLRRRAGLLFSGGVAVGLGLALLFVSDFGWMSALAWVVTGFALVGVSLWSSGNVATHPPQSIVALPEPEQLGEVATPLAPRLLRKERDSALRIVAIGGGTGMPQLLRGLRTYTDNITAIVTVADDGGSSGRLRRQMGMLPPGDFRNNIAALSEAEELMTRLFQYRFARRSDGGDESELAGHSFGNLFIATMAAVTGSFEKGLAESSRVLAVRGRVLPSTLEQVLLCAEIRRPKQHFRQENPASATLGIVGDDNEDDDEIVLVEGESQIPEAGGQILRVFLNPPDVRAYPGAIQAILQADLIVAGPGSFFTSVMPNLLVSSVREAICASAAPRIFVCNVATQPGETDTYSVADHMRQLRLHAGEAFTTVLANHNYDRDTRPSAHSTWVPLPDGTHQTTGAQLIRHGHLLDFCLFTGDLIQKSNPRYHDSAKLAARLLEVYAELHAYQPKV